MVRVQYIRFRDAVMRPGHGGSPSDNYNIKPDGVRRDRAIAKISVADGWVFLEDENGRVRASPWSNVIDMEPIVDAELSKLIGAPVVPKDKGNGKLEVAAR